MADYVLPVIPAPTDFQWTLNDFSGVAPSPFSGVSQTTSRGQRWSASVSWLNQVGQNRAVMAAIMARIRGKANRLWLQDPAYIQRGSFPGGELLTNANFAGGTSGWLSSACSIAVVDGSMKATNTKPGVNDFYFYQSVSVTPYLPYILRSALGSQSIGTTPANNGNFINNKGSYLAGAGPRLVTQAFVPLTSPTTAIPGVFDSTGQVTTAGDWGMVDYCTVQQCALVDNMPNLLLQSNGFSTSPWALTNSPAGSSQAGAPDGTSTKYAFLENTTNGGHYTSQPVTVASTTSLDYVLTCYVQSGTRSWVYLELQESTGGTFAYGYFNIGTGAKGSSNVGTNWANVRTYMTNMGNGWFRCSVVANKSSAGTTVTGIIGSATADGTSSYAGTASATALNLWHASFAQSSVPVDDTVTTSAASSGNSPVGGVVPLRGLPLSTSGLLLPGDMFEINGELKRATSSLDSDASGLGVLTFEPWLRSSTMADGSPVIFGDPMGKFMLTADASQPSRPGPALFSDFGFELAEAP